VSWLDWLGLYDGELEDELLDDVLVRDVSATPVRPVSDGLVAEGLAAEGLAAGLLVDPGCMLEVSIVVWELGAPVWPALVVSWATAIVPAPPMASAPTRAPRSVLRCIFLMSFSYCLLARDAVVFRRPDGAGRTIARLLRDT
jgi:hypothetical protein